MPAATVVGDHHTGGRRIMHYNSGGERVDDGGAAGCDESRHHGKCDEVFSHLKITPKKWCLQLLGRARRAYRIPVRWKTKQADVKEMVVKEETIT
jgi:hypothetical protein